LINTFATLVESAPEDLKVVQILFVDITVGRPIAQLQLEYLEPVDEADPPAVLKEHLSIPSVVSAMINRTMASDTDMLDAQMLGDHRYTFWTGTFKLDGDSVAWMHTLHQAGVRLLPNQGLLTTQASKVRALSHMSKNGGNALCLCPKDGALFHVLLYIVRYDASKDE
jgi:hypothetical protein